VDSFRIPAIRTEVAGTSYNRTFKARSEHLTQMSIMEVVAQYVVSAAANYLPLLTRNSVLSALVERAA